MSRIEFPILKFALASLGFALSALLVFGCARSQDTAGTRIGTETTIQAKVQLANGNVATSAHVWIRRAVLDTLDTLPQLVSSVNAGAAGVVEIPKSGLGKWTLSAYDQDSANGLWLDTLGSSDSLPAVLTLLPTQAAAFSSQGAYQDVVVFFAGIGASIRGVIADTLRIRHVPPGRHSLAVWISNGLTPKGQGPHLFRIEGYDPTRIVSLMTTSVWPPVTAQPALSLPLLEMEAMPPTCVFSMDSTGTQLKRTSNLTLQCL